MAAKKTPKKKAPAKKAAAKSTTPKRRANFQLDAPGASQVCVAGTFNNWDPGARPLKPGKDGVFRTWMSLPPGTYEYRFVVDGEWQDDPASTEHVTNEHGTRNSIIVL